MSFDSIPDCVKKCLEPVAKSLGCSASDAHCICTEDVDSSVGINFALCVSPKNGILPGGTCDGDGAALYNDLQAICAKIAGNSSSSGASSSTKKGTVSTTASAFSTLSTSYSATLSSSAPPTTAGSSGDTAGGSVTSSNKSAGLSAGAAAGIGVAACIVFALLAIGGFYLWRRHRRKQIAAPQTVDASDGKAELSGTLIVEAGKGDGNQTRHELSDNAIVEAAETSDGSRQGRNGQHGLAELEATETTGKQ